MIHVPIIKRHLIGSHSGALPEYNAWIQYGNIDKTFSVSIDNTAAITYAPGPNCLTQHNKNCTAQGKWAYQCLKNKGCKRTSDTIEKIPVSGVVVHGYVFVTGNIVKDSLTISGVKINNVKIVEASKITRRREIRSDALIGLGNFKENVANYFKQQGHIKEAQFSVYFSDSRNDLMFGKNLPIPPSKLISYKVHTNDAIWNIKIANILVNKKSPQYQIANSDSLATFDYTLDMLGLPHQSLINLKKNVEKHLQKILKTNIALCSTQSYLFHCECHGKITNFPNIQIQFEGKNHLFELTPNEYVHIVKIDGKNVCKARVYESGYKGVFVLGFDFMTKYYTVFNLQEQTIKFADLPQSQLHQIAQQFLASFELQTYIGLIVLAISSFLL